MKKYLRMLFQPYTLAMIAFSFAFSFAITALAQQAVDPTQPASANDFFGGLMTFIGGLKGATGMGIATAVTQLVMLFFRTSFAAFSGKFQLFIVLFLNVVGTILAGVATGMPWTAALLNGSTLAAAQVFLHQLLTQDGGIMKQA